MTITEFLPRLQGAKPSGKGYKARCPAHDDRKPSLSLAEGTDGRILLYCHAKCSIEAILSKLGIEARDLFAEMSAKSQPNGKRHIVATYDYRDEGDALLYQAVRYEPKGFKQRRPDGQGGWKWNLGGVRRVLYRLAELLAADPSATIFIVEGEKDADRLSSFELVATCNAGGASNWREEYNEHLRGREVVILPDNDQAGREHAKQVAQSLYRVAASVKILALPGLSEKGDVSDWLDNGGSVETLSAMVDDLPEWTPESEASSETLADDAPNLIQTWDELDAAVLPVGEQIIHELERGEIGLLAAVTNVGKSTLLRNVALALACGREYLPLVKHGPARRVLLLDFETRLVRLQRDLRQMMRRFTEHERTLIGQNLGLVCDASIGDEPLCLSEPKHLAWLRMNVIAFKADIIITDTVAAAFSIHDENSNAEVNSRILKPMVKLGHDTSAAILLSHHIGKSHSEDGKAAEKAYRARGASSFGAFSALVLNLTQDPHDESRKVLSLAKVKGTRFDDVVLTLDREARWFDCAGAPSSEPPTSYGLVLKLFEDGREMKTYEVVAALAGTVSERTAKNCLARAVANGDLECPKRGTYRKVQKVQSP